MPFMVSYFNFKATELLLGTQTRTTLGNNLIHCRINNIGVKGLKRAAICDQRVTNNTIYGWKAYTLRTIYECGCPRWKFWWLVEVQGGQSQILLFYNLYLWGNSWSLLILKYKNTLFFCLYSTFQTLSITSYCY